ncbi:hypothetical protein [Clostridium estertheticum]|uniref:hypothetical protein n=1 Tax=Clostridium estertheticum TaxID=238834 RepID=UPI001CF4D001|nr:hypothetical protein [Clostridium estertheticum]MCB2340884.1 hypothetical protein [Clostridium estertheticum]
MIIWNDNELEHIQKHLEMTIKAINENKYESDNKTSYELLINQIQNVNEAELINAVLEDILDDYYACYWVKGYTSDDLREEKLPWINDIDCDIYERMYEQ